MRIYCLTRDLKGDERRQAVVHHLESSYECVRVPVALSRVERLINLLRTIHPRKDVWREASKKNVYFFTAASRRIATAVRAAGFRSGEVVLGFEALFSPGLGSGMLHPFAMYEDGTSRMSAKIWPEWVPRTARTAEYQRLELECYQGADLLLTSNLGVRQSLIDDYGIAPGKVINVGQGQDFTATAACADPGQEGPILFVGYEFERKGGASLLEAFGMVRAALPSARLTLVGPELSLNVPGVEVLGKVSDKAVLAGLYTSASVFVLPSVFDPMPHAAMEAMSFGVPVIVSDACGTKEILVDGENGYVVPVGKPAILAERLIALLKSPAERRRVGAAGRRTMLEDYSWPSVAARVAAEISGMLAKPAHWGLPSAMREYGSSRA